MKLTALLLGTVLLTGCSWDQPKAEKHQSTVEELQLVNAASRLTLELEQTKLRIQIENQATEIRMQVIKSCVAKGFVPSVFNGNINCFK